ncbi:bifunctional glycosyltransferase/CDP-glycerol:glycerophosphate glycerophosphotransferase [Sporosarcina jiandibaonis]|uniref:bifunctional glycosyltransferase/CDP-glycerol:glycerophosphate glycerophosphotransferase n=1 Tax=Sporosarcina jiandibaonis TaxID=2715535 RepID=UPI00155228EE|nr:CDP-glycerol:glycerophosphate glycerophosphotransferase [Sporosarcina jiandibaonis]
MKSISIIMPIHNTEEFLEQSIQSVLQQTYQHFELLLLNDNSMDNSQGIIDEFQKSDSRIKTHHFTERHGVGAVRNSGIEMATGDYIYFLDSDDFLPPNTLQLLIENSKNFDLLSGNEVLADVSQEQDDSNLPDQNEIKIYTEEKYDLIRNSSVLNRLFSKSFILNNDIRFSEDLECFSDLPFLVHAFSATKEVPYVKGSVYYKRRRNDPISNPSLNQTSMEVQITDFMRVYMQLKDKYIDDKNINLFLDNQLLSFYRGPIVQYLDSNHKVDKVFPVLSDSARRMNSNLVKTIPAHTKKEIRELRKGNIARYKKINLRHQRLRNLKTALKGRRRLYIQLYRSLFMKMPMKKKTVVFESFLGKSYSDSPKYIYEYMINNKMDYNYVWIFNEKKNIPGNAIQVKRFSLKYFYYLARAKYWVSNSRLPITLNKREGNVYLQTWHGTPLKQLVFDMEDVYSADPNYKPNFYKQSRRWDYLSSPNAYSSEIFRRAFKYEKEMLEFGYPRNDILYTKNNPDNINDLKNSMSIPTDKKVVLYAPTWRDDEFFSAGKYKFTLQLELDKLQAELGDNYIVLLRMHYFIANQLDISEYSGFVYDFSSYDDIAELYLVSDILITDYSSVFFDFANLKRPILFYTYDLENYRDKLRGFYLDIENEVPGPLLRTTEEIIDAIATIEDVQKEYQSKYDSFYKRFCAWDNGNASKNTVNAVFKGK